MASGGNRLCARLGCRLPLIQSPMLGSTGERMAVAVAQAGGVGSVPCAGMPLPALDALLGRLQAEHAGLPLVYNFFCHEMPAEAVSAHWLSVMAPLYARAGVADAPARVAAGYASPSTTTTTFAEAHLALLVRHKARAVSLHLGLPRGDGLWARVKASGLVTLASATTVAEARYLQARGVDVVVAQGLEAGGHRGIFLAEPPLAGVAEQVGTFALVPCVRRALGGGAVVVAAGGIADAAGVGAALALGADAVQVGTSFLLCDEALTSVAHRRALVRARAELTPTELTNVLSGRPARGIANTAMRELGSLRADAPPFPYPQCFTAPLKGLPVADEDDKDAAVFANLWCGQNPTGLRACPAADKVRELMSAFPSSPT